MWSHWDINPGEEVSQDLYYGLFALQHRGQESAGMAVSDGKKSGFIKQWDL